MKGHRSRGVGSFVCRRFCIFAFCIVLRVASAGNVVLRYLLCCILRDVRYGARVHIRLPVKGRCGRWLVSVCSGGWRSCFVIG